MPDVTVTKVPLILTTWH